MTLSQRLKKNPWLTNKKFPIAYFLISVVFLALFIFISYDDNSVTRQLRIASFLSIPFTIIFYGVYIAGKMLSVNFIIKNHRQTPLLLGVIIGICTVILFVVRAFVSVTLEIALIYPPAATLLTALLYIIIRTGEGKRLTLLPFAVLTFLIGLTGYFVVSYLIKNYGGLSLIVLAAGIFLAAAIFTLDYFGKKNIPPKEANMATLSARFDNYLNKVFKGLPATDENFTLREQLSAALIDYAESCISSGEDEDKIYADTLDSLGDYSQMIGKYKKNIFARFSGSSNKYANAVVCFFAQAGLTFYYILSMKSANWHETFIVAVFFGLISIVVLFILRIVENFRQNRHKFTALFLGLILIVPMVIISFLITLDGEEDMSISPLFGILIIGTAVSAIVSQVVINLLAKRKERLTLANLAKTPSETNEKQDTNEQ